MTDFCSKLKVLNSLNISKGTFQSLQRIGNIRNAFAHTNITYRMQMVTENEEIKTEVTDRLNVMNGAGEIKTYDPYELMVEFLSHYKNIEPELKRLLKMLSS